MAKELKITTVEDLREYAKGCVIELPAFADGQPFVARVRRPSLLALASNGQIPNSLLSTANELFTGKSSNKKAEDEAAALRDIGEVTRIICEACLMEPTLQEIEEAGLELTDDQVTVLFNYSQQGVKALQSFRQE